MAIYIVLFFLGFILAIGLLAYASVQVNELHKKAEAFGKSLEERYSKPLKGLDEAGKKSPDGESKIAEDVIPELKLEGK
ncbi:MAG: hypothetical protein FWF67_03075 [Fibromonadales bacterium]|nr:hypothetical protein [Fibromonadales bacterium]